ncbi:hypothetical protein LINPERPRIM_LOCUS39366, partial [Linum perenne]
SILSRIHFLSGENPSRHNPKSRSSTRSSSKLWRGRSESQLAWTKVEELHLKLSGSI